VRLRPLEDPGSCGDAICLRPPHTRRSRRLHRRCNQGSLPSLFKPQRLDLSFHAYPLFPLVMSFQHTWFRGPGIPGSEDQAYLVQRTRLERLLSNAQQPLALRLRYGSATASLRLGIESFKEIALFGNTVAVASHESGEKPCHILWIWRVL